MKLTQRIKNLEDNMTKTQVDPKMKAELIDWFKEHPGYLLFAQPENNNGVVMPEHLSWVSGCIIDGIFEEKKLPSTLSSLLEILDTLSETFKVYALF